MIKHEFQEKIENDHAFASKVINSKRFDSIKNDQKISLITLTNMYSKISELLKRSTDFYIEDPSITQFSRFLNKKTTMCKLFKDTNAVKLPYDCCYVEFKFINSDQKISLDVGVTFSKIKENLIELTVCNKVENTKIINVLPIYTIINIDGHKVDIDEIDQLTNRNIIFPELGYIRSFTDNDNIQIYYANEYDNDRYLKAHMLILNAVNNVLKFLNCKNIGTQDVMCVPKKKYWLKKAKTFKPYKYKILVLKPTGKKQQKQAAQGLWHTGLHTCMGHFKTYTKEKPLFGKHTGRYWWQSMARGDKTKGTIEKDYIVKGE